MDPRDNKRTLEDSADDFFAVLNSDRPKLIDELSKNYTYNHLKSILSLRSYKHVDSVSDLPDGEEDDESVSSSIDTAPYMQEIEYGKYIYRSMSGLYHNKKYRYSSVDWLPTKELVDGLISLITRFGIKTVEETNASLAILTAILRRSLKSENIEVTVTCSDPMISQTTSIQLDYANISRRSIGDFSYYADLGAEIPEMIIHTFSDGRNIDPVELCETDIGIVNFIRRGLSKILIAIVPYMRLHVHEWLFEAAKDSNYKTKMYFIKAFSKYFDLVSLMNSNDASDMIAYVFIREDIEPNFNGDLPDVFEKNSVFHSDIVNTYTNAKTVYNIYPYTSFKIIKEIYEESSNDLLQWFVKVKKLKHVMKFFKSDEVVIPHFIHRWSEVKLWVSFIAKRLYLWFDTRGEYDAFHNLLSIYDKEPGKLLVPSWMTSRNHMIWWIYMISTGLSRMYMVDMNVTKSVCMRVMDLVYKNNMDKLKEFL